MKASRAPKAIAAGEPLLYKFALPSANHVFLRDHRIMIQVQSSWFPLYDRNPQTFVPSIFWAKPSDYKKATQRVYHSADHASFIDLPVVGWEVKRIREKADEGHREPAAAGSFSSRQ